MTKKGKIIAKFKENTYSIKLNELINLLMDVGFIKIEAKGSHLKFKHKIIKDDIILPIHNNDCKEFYKKQALKKLIDYNLI